MTIIVCIDDRGGMLFNRRRVSRDAAVTADIAGLIPGRLWADEYSAPLFAESGVELSVDSDFLQKAGPDDACFVENRPIAEHLSRAGRLVVYRWNRLYPADFRLDIVPEQDARLRLEQTREFAGRSHERITREVYTVC